jgi:hypothetical protein
MKKYCLLVLMVQFARADGGPGNALFFGDALGKVSVAHTNALNAYPLTVMVWFRFLPFSPPGSVDLVRKHDGGQAPKMVPRAGRRPQRHAGGTPRPRAIRDRPEGLPQAPGRPFRNGRQALSYPSPFKTAPGPRG